MSALSENSHRLPSAAYAKVIGDLPCGPLKKAIVKKISSEDQTPEQKRWLYELIVTTNEVLLQNSLERKKMEAGNG